MLKWLLIPLFFAVLLISGESYHQDDYIVKHERINLTYQNADYLEVRVSLFKYNRTVWAYNSTMKIKRDLSTDLKLKLQAYRFESNEYRLFPLGFTVDICEAHANNTFGSRDIKQLSLTDCPFKKHVFRLTNYIPDQSKFPPRMVAGSYRVNSNLYDKNVHLMEMDWYGSIKTIEHLRYA